MLLPDFCHKFLPGYVGGVQEGAVTPAGNLGPRPRRPHAAFPCLFLLQGLTSPHPTNTHTHTASRDVAKSEVRNHIPNLGMEIAPPSAGCVVGLTEPLPQRGHLDSPGARGAQALTHRALGSLVHSFSLQSLRPQPNPQRAWLPLRPPAPPGATGDPRPSVAPASSKLQVGDSASGWL